MSAKPVILLIDDMPTNLMLLGNALEPEFDLRIATSGALGLRLAAETAPALILLDVMMPEMDGFEVCRRLKADPLLSAIPVVFVTAEHEPASEATGLSLGAVDYITKPINVGIARQRIRNLVEREQLRNRAEECALQAAERLAELKRNFLRNVSHELRTPLNGILGLAQIGERARDLEKAQQTFQRIHQAGTQLSAQILNVLEFIDAESGDMEIVMEPFSLTALLTAMTSTWLKQAADKGLVFIDTGIDTLGAQDCLGDERRLAQVLEQLLKNAIKFSDTGTVTLNVRRRGDEVMFTVIDSGVGMTAEELRSAFHPFEQADGSLTRRFGGLGLALSLVQRLIERMRGSLHAESTPGQGSRFEFVLPLPLVQ